MSFLVLVLSLVLGWIGYKWYGSLRLSKKLQWLPQVPGWPLLGSISEFKNTSDFLSTMSRLTEKHGKLINMTLLFENLISSTDYEFNEFILGTNKVLNKSYMYHSFLPWLGYSLLTAEAEKWKRRRKLITPAFHFSILEQFVESFESNGKILVEKVNKLESMDSIDIYELVTLYTLDVICETAMGVSINAQKDEKSDYVRSVQEMNRIVIERIISPIKQNDFLFMYTQDYYKQKKALNVLHSFTYSVIDKKIELLEAKVEKSEVAEKDDIGVKKKLAFLDILLQATENGEKLSRNSIREEVDTFMFEGHDTTSSAISFALYLLAQNPDIQNRALEEQRSIFGNNKDRNATYQDLNEMKYLECIIKESLRLYPSVAMFSRVTSEDIYYKGNVIPEGTNINIFAFAVLRDPEYFPDPLKFNPDRFENMTGKHPYCYIPFSAGPRNCIGQRFAYLEMKSAISKILRNFELSPAVPEHKNIIVWEVILKSRSGIKVKMVKRKW